MLKTKIKSPRARQYNETFYAWWEADKIAANIMQRLGDAGAMESLFKRFAAKDGESGRVASCFSKRQAQEIWAKVIKANRFSPPPRRPKAKAAK